MILVKIDTTPRRALSPNKKTHWGTKAKAVERARRRAREATNDALADRLLPVSLDDIQLINYTLGEQGGHWITLHWTVWWEKGRKRMDDMNLVASLKGAVDGIADALGVDDKHMIVATPIAQERSKDGKPYMECRIEINAEVRK